MTTTPVMDVGFGMNGSVKTVIRDNGPGDFESVFNSQSKQQSDRQQMKASFDDTGTVTGRSGDSLKTGDEQRARTRLRELSRNAEERTDIPEEEQQRVAEVFGAAAIGLTQAVAKELGVSKEEVLEAMDELGVEPADLLQPAGLGEVIIRLVGAEDRSVLLTDENLYNSFQTLTEQVKVMIGEADVQQEGLKGAVKGPEEGSVDQQQLTKENPIPENMLRTKAEQSILPKDANSEAVVIKTNQADLTALPEAEPNSKANSADPTQAWDTATQNTQGTKEVFSYDTPEIPTVQETVARTETGRDPAEGKSGRDGHEAGEPGIFLQNMRSSEVDIPSDLIRETFETQTMDTQDIMNQLLEYMKVNLKDEVSSMEMQLHPSSLGTIQIQIESRGGSVTAHFMAQNEAVKAALESQMVQLQEQFEEQGVRVESIEVSVQTRQFEANQDRDGSGQYSGKEPSRRMRIRRINRNDSIPEEETEEDLLVRNMMAADGNMVDYTA